MGYTTSIKELDKWCIMNNHIIKVRNGKLCGLVKDYDR